jgi:hypothetical protein
MDENDFRISDSGFIEQTRILIVPEKFSAPNLRHTDKNLVYNPCQRSAKTCALVETVLCPEGCREGTRRWSYCPKGTGALSPEVLTPGNPQSQRVALKGRKIQKGLVPHIALIERDAVFFQQ